MGRHTRRITTVCWSITSLLATAGEDKVLSLNSLDGDSLKHIELEDNPTDLKFLHTSLSKYGSNEDNAVSFRHAFKVIRNPR